MNIKKVAFVNSGGVYSHAINREGVLKAFKKLKDIEVKEFDHNNLNSEFFSWLEPKDNTIVFVVYPLTPNIRNIKEKGYKVVGYELEGAYELANRNYDLPYFDLIATVDKAAWNWYCTKGILSYHMPLGFDPEIYHSMKVGPEYSSDILMVGVLFNARVYYLSCLNVFRNKYNIRILCAWEDRLKTFNSSHITHVHVKVSTAESVKYINGTKIVLTVNRDYHPTPAYDDKKQVITASTPGRYFMEAACNVFQLMDDSRPEIYEYFNKDKEIITFNGSNDLISKIKYYMNNVQERQEISKNAYLRTMRDHSWDKRIDRLIDFMRKML